MSDDSWKDSYDDWKLASPYDDEPECDHDDYDIDILDGRCRCLCGHSWCASQEQVEAEIKRQREYSEHEERENRRQWWRDLFAPITDPIRTLRRRLFEWRLRRQFPEHVDDDIPF